eukprot:3987015-Prymnesium_polylepis.1
MSAHEPLLPPSQAPIQIQAQASEPQVEEAAQADVPASSGIQQQNHLLLHELQQQVAKQGQQLQMLKEQELLVRRTISESRAARLAEPIPAQVTTTPLDVPSTADEYEWWGPTSSMGEQSAAPSRAYDVMAPMTGPPILPPALAPPALQVSEHAQQPLAPTRPGFTASAFTLVRLAQSAATGADVDVEDA